MGVITKIQVQKQSAERYNIFVDETYAFSVDEHTLVKHGLTKGMEIDELALGVLLYDEEVRKCYLQAVSYLSYQMRTKQEIEDHVRKKGYGATAITEAITTLSKDGYVDDAEYAAAYVRTHSKVGRKGPQTIRRDLLAKGVQEAIIINSLHEYPTSKQIRNAVALCEKKMRTYRNESAIQVKRKLEEMLLRGGYTSDVIQLALQEIEVEEEEDAVLHQARKYHAKHKKHEGFTYKQKMMQSLYQKGFCLEDIERALVQIMEDM